MEAVAMVSKSLVFSPSKDPKQTEGGQGWTGEQWGNRP